MIEVAPATQNVVRIEDVTNEALNQTDVLNTLVVKSSRPEVFRRVASMTNIAQHPAIRPKGAQVSEGSGADDDGRRRDDELRRNNHR